MNNIDLIAEPWEDYELLDSGDNKKLERYGAFTVIRPETQAIWQPSRPVEWKKAQAEFSWNGGKGAWKNKGVPASWEMSWGDVRFTARLTSFKHTGIFPEQAVNWAWLKKRVAALENPQVLNLFGYTGIASIVGALGGAAVTHIDASKQSNLWAKENAKLSGVPEGAMRVLLDDALRFAEREVRRGHVYEGIILDPPAFGRGPENEVWRIEEDMQKLLDVLAKLLAKKPGSFFLLNGYAAGYSPQSFLQAVGGSFPEAKNAEFGEIAIRERTSDRIVPSGIYLRFVR